MQIYIISEWDGRSHNLKKKKEKTKRNDDIQPKYIVHIGIFILILNQLKNQQKDGQQAGKKVDVDLGC